MRKVLSIMAVLLIIIMALSMEINAKADEYFLVDKLYFTTSITPPTDGSIKPDALHAVNVFLDIEQSLLNETNFTDRYVNVLIAAILNNRIEYSNGSVAFHGDGEKCVVLNSSSALDVMLVSDSDDLDAFNSSSWIENKDFLIALKYRYDFINQKTLSTKVDNILVQTESVLENKTTTKIKSETDGLYTYVINEDMSVTITKFDWSNNHGDIYIPEMLGNRIVTGIGEKAFAISGNDAVSITLPEGIKSIGELAFEGVAIKYINIPLNTSSIGDGAFSRCSVMQFRVADGHQVFATIDNALYNKQEKMLIAWPENKEIAPIPNGIKAIGGYVFYGRKIYESSITKNKFLPDTLTTIGKYAFAEGSFTAYLNNVSVINEYAFYRNYAKHNEHVPEVKLWDEEPLKLSRVGAHAFENTSIDLISISKIEEGPAGAWGRPGRRHCLLSSTPYVVDEYAFCNTLFYSGGGRKGDRGDPGSLEPIDLSNVTSIGDYAFAYDDSTAGWIGLYSTDFDNLTYLGEYAFSNNKILGTLHLSNIKKVSESAFASGKCDIIEIVLGTGIEEIAPNAFAGQSHVTTLTMNEGLKTIGSESFRGCSGLTEVKIPKSVTYIGDNVFADCAVELVITVEAGSYSEVWARTCGYSYKVNGKVEDTSWLDD